MPARRALFIFAHQDDEYGAAPWIVDEIASGTQVACVYLTSGKSRTPSIIRDAESRAALRSLGVPADAMAFLSGSEGRIPDLQLPRRSMDALETVRTWLRTSSFRPDRLYAPSYEGGHPDHDAAHLVAARIAIESQIVDEAWHFSLYNAYRCPRPLFSTLRQLPSSRPWRPASASASAWKRLSLALLCARYRSQWQTWIGLFPGAFWERFVLGRERVVQFDLPRLAARPHEGELLYERRFGMTYVNFAEQTLELLAQFAPL